LAILRSYYSKHTLAKNPTTTQTNNCTKMPQKGKMFIDNSTINNIRLSAINEKVA